MTGLPYGHVVAFNADHNLHLKFAKLIKEKFGDNYEEFVPVNLEDLPPPMEENVGDENLEDIKREEELNKIDTEIDDLYE